jgi:hypothetical protein
VADHGLAGPPPAGAGARQVAPAGARAEGYTPVVGRWLLAAAAAALTVGGLWYLRCRPGVPAAPAVTARDDAAPARRVPSPPGEVARAMPRAEAPLAVPDFTVPDEDPPRPRGEDPSWRPAATSALEDDAAMARAEWLLDAGQTERARQAAHDVLADHPDEPRMLRVVVLAACALGGDGDKEARQYFAQLPAEDRDPVVAACRQTGIDPR